MNITDNVISVPSINAILSSITIPRLVITMQGNTTALLQNNKILPGITIGRTGGVSIVSIVLGDFVPKSTTVNGHMLTQNITLNKTDVGLANVPNVNTTDPGNILQSANYRFASDSEKATWNISEAAEQLQGPVNNINTIFTTTQNFITNSAKVYINGLLQQKDTSYTENNNNQIIFSEAPNTSGFPDYLFISYRKA